MKVLLYVQHLLGIGHLARTSRIAQALAAEGFGVTMVSGGEPVAGFPGAGIDLIQLPPIRSRDQAFGALVDPAGEEIDDRYKADRRGRLLAAFGAVRPDILIIEAFPFGRRQMRFELLPLIEAARMRTPAPLIVSSIRDILQENKKPGRAEETAELVHQYFDLVLVHGDANFARIEETFPSANMIADKVMYTGLVAPPRPEPAAEHYDAVVSAGGGAAGSKLIAAALEVAPGSGLSWCIITGPNAAPVETKDAAALFRFRSDFPGLLMRARVSVSQAGYNTVCDILNAHCGAVLIPFAQGGETEQSLRAAKLKALGLAEVVSEDDLTPRRLAEAISSIAHGPRNHQLDLGGARRTAQILKARLSLRNARSA